MFAELTPEGQTTAKWVRANAMRELREEHGDAVRFHDARPRAGRYILQAFVRGELVAAVVVAN